MLPGGFLVAATVIALPASLGAWLLLRESLWLQVPGGVRGREIIDPFSQKVGAFLAFLAAWLPWKAWVDWEMYAAEPWRSGWRRGADLVSAIAAGEVDLEHWAAGSIARSKA